MREVTQTILSARRGAVPLQTQHSGTETGALGQPGLQHETVSEVQNRPTKACSQLESGSHPIIEAHSQSCFEARARVVAGGLVSASR